MAKEIANIPADSQKKEDDIKAIEQKFKGNLTAKKTDLKVESQQKGKKIKNKGDQQSRKVNEQLGKWLKKNFVDNLVLSRLAQAYFNCESKIKKDECKIKDHLKGAEEIYGKTLIREVYSILREYDNNFAKMIISQQKVFQGLNCLDFQNKASGKSFDQLLDKMPEMKKRTDAKEMLQLRYKRFINLYDSLLVEYKGASDYDEYLR